MVAMKMGTCPEHDAAAIICLVLMRLCCERAAIVVSVSLFEVDLGMLHPLRFCSPHARAVHLRNPAVNLADAEREVNPRVAMSALGMMKIESQSGIRTPPTSVRPIAPRSDVDDCAGS